MTSNEPKAYNWAENSAIFNIVPNSIFLKDKLSFRVKFLINDPSVGLDSILENPTMIKQRIFNIVLEKYNQRINTKRLGKELQLKRLTESDIVNLSLKKMKVSENSNPEDSNASRSLGGIFEIYPRTFVCSNPSCSRFYFFKENNFPDLKCRSCNSQLEQISVVKFCEECGKIDQLYPSCSKCGKKSQGFMKLIRGKKDSLITWRWICNKGHEEDVLQGKCDHWDRRSKEPYLSRGTSAIKFKFLTVRENSVITPQCINLVDIKDTKNIKKVEELDLVLFGIATGSFESLEKETEKNILEFINENYGKYYSNKEAAEGFLRENQPNISKEEVELKWRKHCFMDKIEGILEELRKKYPPENYDPEELNNYSALKGIFSGNKGVKKYTDFVSKDEYRLKLWNKYRKKFKIKEIFYLENIRLVSTAIGLIKGYNKNEENYFPHFEPLWDDYNMINRQNFSAFINPYDTEGLLIDFDKEEIFRWLKENNSKIKINEERFQLNAQDFFLTMDKNSKEYGVVKTLLHTLSHLLIKKSGLYTGIDENSCSEMVFPMCGAILIFSTGNVNIGGFGHLFENSLFDLLGESDYELRQCIYDPSCNSRAESHGACFSCIYLPEHVCRYYNMFLDRDILSGKIRYEVPFWTMENDKLL